MMRGENYVVTVYGILVDGNGKGVPNQTIYINNTKNSKFIISEKASTYASGEFKWPVNIPDSVKAGALILSYLNCDNKEIITEVHFNKEHPTTESKLHFL
jgi:hypothetical protein